MQQKILDIGRLEMKSDEIKLQPVDVCEIVGRRVEDCATVDDHRHSFSFDCVQDALPALSAPHLIDRVIDNLLSNAVKYSPQGTRVGIRVWPENGWAVIVVEDSGIGIPEAELPLLFTPFYRAGNSGDVSGSGLGLLIVKRSLELIGGEVRLESRLNIGTRVEVRIPLSNGPL